MGVSGFSGRLLRRFLARSPQQQRQRRPAPLRVRGLEKRIVLDATIAVAGGSVDISGLSDGTNISVTREAFNIDNDVAPEDAYRFSMNAGAWNGGQTGPINLDADADIEAFIDGADLYVDAQFLETNPGGLSVTAAGPNRELVLETNITTAGNQDYSVRVRLEENVTLTAPVVTFNDRVSGSGHSLAITGNAVFGNDAADSVTGLGPLAVSGQSTINTSEVTSTGFQNYGGLVTIGASAGTAVLTTADSAILFGSTLDLGSHLTVETGSGNATFSGVVNGAKNLVVNSTGNTTFLASVGSVTPLASLTTNAGGTTFLNAGAVSTSGGQTWGDDISLGANTTLTGSLVTFTGRVVGENHSLAIVGGAGFGNEATDTVTGLTTLTVSGATTIHTNVVTTSGLQTYSGAVTVGAPAGTAVLTTTNGDILFGSTLLLESNLMLSAGAGNVTFTGAVNGGSSLVVNSTGSTTFRAAVGDAAALNSLTTNVGGTTFLNGGSIATTGHQTYGDQVSLGAGATLVSTGGIVTFLGAVAGNGNSLAIDGDAVFGDGPGDTVTGLSALSVTGTATINTSSITSTGNQTYGDAVTLGANTTLTGQLITFLGTVSGGGRSLSITGNVVFGDEATDTVTGLSTLLVSGQTTINTREVTSTGTQTYSGAATIGNPAGTVVLTTTNSAALFGSTLELGSHLTVATGSGNVTFTGAVNGARNLVINSTGNTTFLAAVGNVIPLATMTTNAGGATFLNGGSVGTSGNQTYGDGVSLRENATLVTAAGVATFLGTVAGNGKSLSIQGNAIFGDGAADTVTGLSTLAVTGTTTINTREVTSTGTQIYSGAVTISAPAGTAVLTTTDSAILFGATLDLASHLTVEAGSGNVTFTGAVNGAKNLVVDSTGNTTFLAAVGNVNPLLSVTTNAGGTTFLNGGFVATSGNQTYSDNVSLGANTTLASPAGVVTFLGTVIGNGRSLSITGNAVFGNEAADTVTGLSTLLVSGQTTINTREVTSTGTQTYSGAATVGAPAETAVLTTANSAVLFGSTVDLLSHLTLEAGSGNVTFTGAVNGAKNLIVNSVGTTTFLAAVGNVTPLASLATNPGGTTQLNGGSVMTSGNQSYGDDVTLGVDSTLTGALVTFLGTVDGRGSSLSIVGDAMFGDEASDTVTGFATLSVSGLATIRTREVTTTGTQTYSGAVTIGATAGTAVLSTTDSDVFFGASVALNANLTVSTGSGNATFSGAVDGPHHLAVDSTVLTIFNGRVGSASPLASVTTNAGGATQINGGGIRTSGDQLYADDIQVGPGTQALVASTIHFFERVDGLRDREGDLEITGTEAVFFDKAIGSVRDPGSVKVQAGDITFAENTFIEVGKSAAESVHIVATGTLTLPVGFEVRAAWNGGVHDGVANRFFPRPAPGVTDAALVSLPVDRPIISAVQNLDQSATATIELVIGNPGERGLRVFVDWGDTVGPVNRFEGPGGWANGDGLGENNAPGDLFAIDGGATISLTHTYTPEDVQRQLSVDNTFDVKYAVFQHEAIVIEAARVEQGRDALGAAGGPMNVLTTTMLYRDPGGPRFEPPPPATVPDLVNGTVAIQLPPPSGSGAFEIPTTRPEPPPTRVVDAPPLPPLVTFQQVTKDDSASSSPVVGRQQRFVLRLLSPDPTAPPLAEVDLPPDSFRADRLQRLFQELPDGAYEIDLLLGENTERPILRFDIRQGRPVVPQESLDGGQLKLEEIEETLKKSVDPPAPAVEPRAAADLDSEDIETAGSESAADVESSSRVASPAGTMTSWLEWQVRRRAAAREGSLTLASRLARRVQS